MSLRRPPRTGLLNMKQVELEITDLAFDGKAVALLYGKVVFLDSGLPGEMQPL